MLGKMGAILSDPESVQQLQELAQMLQQETGGESQGQQASAEKTESGEGGGFDINMLLRIQELMGAMQNNDEDAKLLLALRPHLKDQRQKKLDQAVKLMKLYAVFSAVRTIRRRSRRRKKHRRRRLVCRCWEIWHSFAPRGSCPDWTVTPC